MCHIVAVLETLRKKRTISNKDIVALGEAQAADTMEHKREHREMVERMTKLESDVSTMKDDISTIKGNIQVIMEYIKSPVDSERLQGAYWKGLVSIIKSPKTWILILVFLAIVGLAGDKILQLFGWIPATIGA